MRQNLHNSYVAGFTLVELMVVVAMIGVLAAIAIPQYSKFTAKARQAEAKINLAAAYAALQGFAAENGSYTMCLKQAGYIPDGPHNNCGPSRYYIIGLDERFYTSNTCGSGGNQPCGYYAFIGQGTAACNSTTPQFPCCSAGWVYGGNGGCGTSDFDHSDSQYPVNATLAKFSGGPYYPHHGHLYALNTMVDANHFVLGAAGGISSSPGGASCIDSQFDGWTIDQNKTLANPNPCL